MSPRKAAPPAPTFHVVWRTPVFFAVVRCGCGCGGTAAQIQFPDGRCLGVNPHRSAETRGSARKPLDFDVLQSFGRYGLEALRLVGEAAKEMRKIGGRG